MSENTIRLLQQMPVFGGIKSEILEMVMGLSSLVSVAKDDFFFHEGDRGSSMFVLDEGKVAILKRSNERDFLLSYLERGDCFGEMSLMDFCPRSASVLAVEDSTAIELTNRTMLEVYRQDMEQFTMMQMNMGREVSRRLREADRRLFEAKVEADQVGGEYFFYST